MRQHIAVAVALAVLAGGACSSSGGGDTQSTRDYENCREALRRNGYDVDNNPEANAAIGTCMEGVARSRSTTSAP